MNNAQLKAIATSLETKAGASTTANDSREGWWKRIAAASETIAGASTTANDGLEGYILRSAKAMEVLSATSGAEETDGYTGFLKRFVDALEVKSGTVGTSDIDSRAVTAAMNAVFSAYAAYALALDFKNGAYWVGGAQAASLAALPGYSYTRSGAIKLENEFLGYGEEKVTNGTFDANVSGWGGFGSPTITFDAGRMKIVTPAAGHGADQIIANVKANTVYRVRATLQAGASSQANLQLYDAGLGTLLTSQLVAPSTTGTVDATFNTGAFTSVRMLIRAADAADTIYADNVSVQEVFPTPNLTYLGSELLTNGGFDSDTIWGKGTGWTISGGAARFDGASSFSQLEIGTGVIPQGRTGQVTIVLSAVGASVTGVRIVMGGSYVGGFAVSGPGTYTSTFTNTGSGSQFGIQSNFGAGGAVHAFVVDNVSVKEVIPEALDSFAPNVPGIVPGVGYWSRGAVTNLLTYSQDLDNAAWANAYAGGTRTGNTTLSPDGTLTADTLTATGANQWVLDQYTGGALSSGTYTFDIWLKRKTGTGAIVISPNLEQPATYADVTAQVTSTAWTRVSATGALGAAHPGLRLATAGDEVYAWQGQLVAGSDPGPIIPTGATTASVGADVMTVANPIVTDQDFIIYATMDIQSGDAVNKSFFTLSDGTFANYIYVYRHQSIGAFTSVNGPSIALNFGTGSTQMSGRMTLLLRRQAGSYTLFSKNHATGAIANSGPSATGYPTGMTQINVGSFIGGEQPNSPLLQTPLIKTGTFTDAEITTLLEAL